MGASQRLPNQHEMCLEWAVYMWGCLPQSPVSSSIIIIIISIGSSIIIMMMKMSWHLPEAIYGHSDCGCCTY